jgi:hypothetical protein
LDVGFVGFECVFVDVVVEEEDEDGEDRGVEETDVGSSVLVLVVGLFGGT